MDTYLPFDKAYNSELECFFDYSLDEFEPKLKPLIAVSSYCLALSYTTGDTEYVINYHDKKNGKVSIDYEVSSNITLIDMANRLAVRLRAASRLRVLKSKKSEKTGMHAVDIFDKVEINSFSDTPFIYICTSDRVYTNLRAFYSEIQFKSITKFIQLILGSADVPTANIKNTFNMSGEGSIIRDPRFNEENSIYVRLFDSISDEVCIIDCNGKYTYSDLIRESLRKSELIKNQIQSKVLIYQERGFSFITSILGSIFSGKSYLPIEVGYPRGTIDKGIIDKDKYIALVDGKNLPNFESLDVNEALNEKVDISESLIKNDLFSFHKSDNVVYEMLTSGSTGSPKLIGISRKALNISTIERVNYYGNANNYLLISPLHFDSSVAGLFWTLFTQGTLIIPSKEQIRSDSNMLELIESQNNLTTLGIPSYLSTLINKENSYKFDRVILAGEKLSAYDFEWFSNFFETSNFYNEYGPTENAVWTSVKRYKKGEIYTTSIGSPLTYVETKTLTRSGNFQLEGFKGELIIYSPCLSDSIEESKLVSIDSKKYYKTGDIVSLVANELFYFGRADSEVKINGVRYNLSSINSSINEINGVNGLVFNVGNNIFLAHEKDEVELIEKIKESLEGLGLNLSPRNIFRLEKLPKNVNGKIDEKKLKDKLLSLDINEKSIEKISSFEKKISSIFEDVLQRKIVLSDNFFDCGGDSLSASIIASRLSKELGEKVYVKTILENSNVKSLCDYISKNYLANFKEEEKFQSRFDLIVDRFNFSKGESPRKTFDEEIIFILGPQRSGTTLLRLILSKSKKLFVPEDLELAAFSNYADRHRWINKGNQIYSLGLEDACNKLDLSFEEKEKEWNKNNIDIVDIYSTLSELSGNKIVDKSPLYSYNLENLNFIIRRFPNAKFLRIIRNPKAVASSMREARIDTTLFKSGEVDRNNFGGQLWELANKNIDKFLSGIQESRKYTVCYERLVTSEEQEIRSISEFLGIEFTTEMLNPFSSKITNKLGDYKISQYKKIEDSRLHSYLLNGFTSNITENAISMAQSYGVFPLENYWHKTSLQQRDLWLSEKLEGNRNIPFYFEQLSEFADFRLFLISLMHKHSSLRSCLKIVDNEFKQKISSMNEVKEKFKIDEIQEKDISSYVKKDFDLDEGVLIRAASVKTMESKWKRYIIVFSHMSFDYCSLGIFRKELFIWKKERMLSPALEHYYEYCYEQGHSNVQVDNICSTPSIDSENAINFIEGSDENILLEEYIPVLLTKNGESKFEKYFTIFIETLEYFGASNYFIFVPDSTRENAIYENVIGLFSNMIGIPVYENATDIDTIRKNIEFSRSKKSLGVQAMLKAYRDQGLSKDKKPIISFSYVNNNQTNSDNFKEIPLEKTEIYNNFSIFLREDDEKIELRLEVKKGNLKVIKSLLKLFCKKSSAL